MPALPLERYRRAATRTGALEIMTCAPPFSLSSIAIRLFTTNNKHIICTLGKKTNACEAPPLVTIKVVRKTIALVRQSCPSLLSHLPHAWTE